MRSVTISANLEALPVGEATAQVRALGDDILPDGTSLSFSGAAEAFIESVQQFGMALATAAGMFSSTLLTLLVVPVFYLAIDDAVEWLKSRLRSRSHLAGEQPAI